MTVARTSSRLVVKLDSTVWRFQEMTTCHTTGKKSDSSSQNSC